jgi:hypothetical protein
MEKKICSKCKTEKDKNDFYLRKESVDGYRKECKKCFLEISKKKYLEDKNKKIESSKKYYNSNREIILEKRKDYYKTNIEKIITYRQNNNEQIKEVRKTYLEKNNEKIKIYKKDYRKKNKKNIQFYRNKYNSQRVKDDVLYKISLNIRSRIRQFLKQNGFQKKSKTFELIGCSPIFLKEHIEKQFTEGMSWDKMGQYIHIDHIIPLSSAKTEEDVYKLCHYTNLQPLWAEDNLKKSNKIMYL